MNLNFNFGGKSILYAEINSISKKITVIDSVLNKLQALNFRSSNTTSRDYVQLMNYIVHTVTVQPKVLQKPRSSTINIAKNYFVVAMKLILDELYLYYLCKRFLYILSFNV